MKSVFIYFVFLLFVLNVELNNGARILVLIPVPSYSHQIAYQALWKALHKRGHEIFLVTPDPIPDESLTNLTQFSIRGGYDYIKPINFLHGRKDMTWLNMLETHILALSEPLAEIVYNHSEFKKVYAPNSGQKFDVVIAEAILTPACFALAYRFNAPLIGTYSLGLMQNFNYAIGNPVLTSHPSNWELGRYVGVNLPFWKRLKNFFNTWYHLFTQYETQFYMPQQKVANKYLGNIPPIKEIEKNMSIVLVNQQHEISYPRPNVPSIINFGSLHVTDDMKPLPKALQEFIANAPNGFIYVSLGTNVQTDSFSTHLKNVFFDVLSNLPLKVVWKYKGDLPKSDNIFMAEWFSQRTLLAHPKLKLFVYQGGLQSTEEAVHFGIPLVGLPVLADQDMQVNRLESLGACKFVEILDVTKEKLDQAIREVLNDKRYKENMLRISKLVKDKPWSQLENVIWWIEYVIRNKGAPHFRTSIVDEPWYQRYDTDIIAFLSITSFIALLLGLYIAFKILIAVVKYYAKSFVNEKKKTM